MVIAAFSYGSAASSRGQDGSNPGTNEILDASDPQGAMLSATGYIAIYADSAHSIYSCLYPAQYTMFDVWIWCLPSDRGLKAAEFMVDLPAKVYLVDYELNPAVTTELGTPTTGSSVAFFSCQEDWVYTHHLTCMSAVENVPSTIEIVEHPESGTHQFANCWPGHPLEPCNVLTNLYLYQCDDHYPPYISGISIVSETGLEAQYNEAVTEESAENLANYYVCTLNCAVNIPIASITLLPDQRTISISLSSPLTKGIVYYLGYVDIEDLHGNVLDYRILAKFGYAPDLVISNPWAEPDSIYLDAPEIEVGYTIKNSGNWRSGPFDATIRWYGGTSDTLAMANISYDSLAVGDSLFDTIQIAVPPIRTAANNLVYYIDYLDHVGELDDTNNRATKRIHVYLPNLSIGSGNVVAEPNAVTDGCTAVRLRYQIDNLGPVDAGAFPASISLTIHASPSEERLLATIDYPGLAAGASIVDSFTTTLPPDLADDNSLLIYVNKLHTFVESAYYDNSRSASLPNYAPRIVSIEDRPNDAGGFVTLTFYRCRSDVINPPNPITRYDIISEDSGLIVGQVPAMKSNYYSDTVATIADSISSGVQWSIYRVRAVRPIVGTADTVYHYSCPDSGYSVNNQIATLLQSFAVSLKELRIEMTWRLADRSDAPEFLILRESKTDRGFIPAVRHSRGAPRIHFCRLRYRARRELPLPGGIPRWRGAAPALRDRIHRPSSPPPHAVPESPESLQSGDGDPVLPAQAGPVRLEIFDVRGRRVVTLVDTREDRGMRSIQWNGIDGDGSAVGTGIYFYRLAAGKETVSKKMILLR